MKTLMPDLTERLLCSQVQILLINKDFKSSSFVMKRLSKTANTHINGFPKAAADSLGSYDSGLAFSRSYKRSTRLLFLYMFI